MVDVVSKTEVAGIPRGSDVDLGQGYPARRPVERRVGSSLIGWIVCGLSGVLVALRLAHRDGQGLIVGAIALSPWIFLPALVVAVAALSTRRRVMAIVAVVVIAVPLWWSVDQFDPLRHDQTASPSSPRLRILDANVTWTNNNMESIVRAVARDGPDIVALQEVTPLDIKKLQYTPQFAHFCCRLLVPEARSAGMALWSDHPLVGAAEWDDAGHPELRAGIRIGTTSLSILVVHTFIPIGLSVTRWKQELHGIALAAGRLHGPRIVVGDFNATWDMYEFGDILHTGLRDAAVETGHGWKLTWAPVHWSPDLAQIDHLLTSSSVRVASYQVGSDPGSQHRLLLATIALRR